MTATLILRNQQYEVKHGSTLRVALLRLQIQPDTVLATRHNELITDDEILRDGDLIKLVSVISGG
jgi:sulfur carrier protein ThiS